MRNILQRLPVTSGLFFVLVLSIWAPASCRELALPFILSDRTCSLPEHFEPVCTCITQYNISNFDNLCRSHEAFSGCLQAQLLVGEASFLHSMYPELHTYLVHERLRYICDIYKDIKPDLESCSYEPHTSNCDLGIMSRVKQQNGSFSEKEACEIVNYYSDCYWAVNCPPKVKHVLSSSAKMYSPYTCAKHGRAVTKTCVRLTSTLYPDTKRFRQQCIDSVYTMKECFVREHLFMSGHPEDIIASRELDIDRQENFGLLRCQIEEERDHQCSSMRVGEQKECFRQYLKDIRYLESRISREEIVKTEDICRIYDNVTQCMTYLFTKCPVESVYFNSILCAAMPTSCQCPVNIDAERTARSSRAAASVTQRYSFVASFFAVSFVYTWYA